MVIVVVLSIGILAVRILKTSKPIEVPAKIAKLVPIPIPFPTVIIYPLVEHYVPPTIPSHPSYTLIFVGDSMTEAFGENFDFLRSDLINYYGKKEFGIFNYGFGSTNILSLMDRLQKETNYQGRKFMAILPRYFDIIFVESMGTNPLSQFPLEKGLLEQTKALEKVVAEIAGSHPDSLIVFLATIAPSQTMFGKGVLDLSPAARNKWANERRAYIENHINFAKSHNIPLINVYEKTLNNKGLTIQKYLDPNNYIHPSAEGVHFMSQMIADYLFQDKILLK